MKHVDPIAIGQIAFNHLGGDRLSEWYREGLGLLPSGATFFGGPPATKVNGLPFPLFGGRWLMDGRDWFQLEFFRFLRPTPQPRRADETPADLGYRRVGFHVRDFDATLASLAERGSEPWGPVLGAPGERRTCVRDPEGNWVELMEADPLTDSAPAKTRPEVPATVRSVTISVADLDAAREAWVEGVGLEPAKIAALHQPEHEALWGLEGASSRCLVLDGGGILVELVEYTSPKGRPRPDGYRICDQGLMNVAIAVRDRETFDRTFARWVERGLRPTNPTPLEVGIFRVMYFDLPSGQNVELIYPRRWAWKLTGFAPAGVEVAEEVLLDAPPEAVFAALADHAGLARWSPFAMERLEAGNPDPNGLGALRRVRMGPLAFDERVISWDPPHHYTYTVEKGPLVRRHRGDVQVRRDGDRTRVRWAIQIGLALPGAGKPTGWLLRRKVRGTLDRLAGEIARSGQRRS
ncbi:MAG: SRPBCC family protein [Deltaproteobacteria bacterium]|nr:SRPBCC family protein [Deltaproteobacteria bacterium]